MVGQQARFFCSLVTSIERHSARLPARFYVHGMTQVPIMESDYYVKAGMPSKSATGTGTDTTRGPDWRMISLQLSMNK